MGNRFSLCYQTQNPYFMKMFSNHYLRLILAASFTTVTLLTSCTKEVSEQEANINPEVTSFAVAASQTTGISGNTQDSVYIMHECKEADERKAVSDTSLPAAISTYLSASYGGYNFHKAFAVYEADDNSLKGYIIIVYYNDKPVALRFNKDGSFRKVLEQREKQDIGGKGWHLGGRFHNRNGMLQDTISIALLPAGVLTYFTTTYSTDTIIKAFEVHQKGYLLLSVNNAAYATAFNASGQFLKRVRLHAHEGKATVVEAAALPAAITTYLTQTYPGYVFNRAFSIAANGTLKGYVVMIDANNTRYGIAFDAQGNFEAAKAIR